jgi:hypothetical protein
LGSERGTAKGEECQVSDHSKSHLNPPTTWTNPM